MSYDIVFFFTWRSKSLNWLADQRDTCYIETCKGDIQCSDCVFGAVNANEWFCSQEELDTWSY